jgi:SAM-dependent methyltransferase
MSYVHGYDDRESERLHDQAGTLVELLHGDTSFPAGARVLEAGCGVGAQTVTLSARSPKARFTSIDVSPESIAVARKRGLTNVEFRVADLFTMAVEQFDHVFVCFVLEHLPDPVAALTRLKGMLRPGGTITVIEGDHGSAYFHPETAAAHEAIQALVTLQRDAGGDSLIGRRLYPLLRAAAFEDVTVSPRMLYVDGSRPDLIDGFTRKTFTAMIEGVRAPALERGLIAAERFDEGIRDLYRTAADDGTFSYTFFKARGVNVVEAGANDLAAQLAGQGGSFGDLLGRVGE